MIDVRKPTNKPITVIRAASGHELSNYEKNKLAGIEENAQKNKIEIIKLNDERLQIDSDNKAVTINVGNLAFKNKVGASDLDTEEMFFIKCDLDESIINK